MRSADQPPLLVFDDASDASSGIGLVDLLTWVGERKKLVGGLTLLALLASTALVWAMPDMYTARTTLLPPTSQQQSSSAAALAALGTLGTMAGAGAGAGFAPKTPDELYVGLLKSDSVSRALATQFDLKTRYNAKTFEALRRKMAKRIRVSSDKKSGLISVDVSDAQAGFAAALANAHSAEITKLLSRLAVSEAQQRRIFFEQQLKDTKENLIKAEQALRAVQEKSGMVVLDKQAEAIITAVVQLKTRIAEREVKLQVLRTATTSENPDVRMLNSELSALRSELARMESSTSTRTALASDKSARGIDIPVGQLPAAAVDYVRALREVKFQETMLSSMLRQFEMAKMDESKEAPALQQVDMAIAPDRKSDPDRPLLVVIATFAAALAAAMFAAWRGYALMVRQKEPSHAEAWRRLSRAWKWR